MVKKKKKNFKKKKKIKLYFHINKLGTPYQMGKKIFFVFYFYFHFVFIILFY